MDGGKAVETKDLLKMSPPHKHAHKLGMSHHGDAKHVKAAIDAALKAKRDWERMPWEERAAIYLKAADLISGPYNQRGQHARAKQELFSGGYRCGL